LYYLQTSTSLPTRFGVQYTFSVLELDQFVLSSETTYSQYVQAVSSSRVPTRRLLPPNFPVIRLRFRCDVFYKLHHHCPGDGSWEVEMKRTFRSDIETQIFSSIRKFILV